MPIAWILFALALAAKPSVVVVPVVWLLFVFVRDGKCNRWACLHFSVLLGLAIAVACIARFAQPSGSNPNTIALMQRVWGSIDSLGFYILQVVSPIAFCPDYGRTPEWVIEQGITSASVVGVAYLALLALILFARKWQMAAVLMVFPAVLGPVLGLLPFSHQQFSTVTDRYAYIAMIAPAYLLARMIVMPRTGRVWPLAFGGIAFLASASLETAKHWRNTESMWENVLIVNPQSGSAWTNLGYQHEIAGRNDQAIEFYQRAIKASPGNALAYNNIGNIYFRAQKYDRAYAAYKRARIANPSDLHARNNLGVINHQRGQLKEAEARFRAVIAINPHFAPAHENLGLVLTERGRDDEAESSYRAAIDIDPGYRAALRNLADVLTKHHKDAEARAMLSRAIGLEESRMEFQLAWSRMLIQTKRDGEDIRSVRLEAVELGCREPSILVELGRGLFLSGDFEQAEPILRLATKHAPDRIEPRLDLAQILVSSDRWDDFRTLILATVRDFPFSAAAWQNIAIYHVHNQNDDKAKAAVLTAIRLNPNFGPSLQMARNLGLDLK